MVQMAAETAAKAALKEVTPLDVATRTKGALQHRGEWQATSTGMGVVEKTSEDALVNDNKVNGDISDVWTRVAQRLRAELGEDLYSSWFARMEPVDRTNETIIVSVPTRFLRNWIQSHYRDKLIRIWASELEGIADLEIRVRTRGAPVRPLAAREKAGAVTAASNSAASPAAPVPQAAAGDLSAERGSPLDRSMTFDGYVVGRSNALAHAAALRVADAESGAPVSFNPLYIHSVAGLGKTHLLHAIAWRVRERAPERRVLYLTAERFMYHFIAALKAKEMLAFKDFFQGVDVLLIDDFQFLQGRTMQQEFCHTFNSLVDNKRQVIIAADLPPAQMDSIDDRMRSRLAGGLVVDIEMSELDLRRSILRTRLDAVRRRDPSLEISEEVLEYVANKIQNGGRELEGALTRIVASQQLAKSPMTVDMAALALRDLVRPNETRRIKIDDILRVVGQHYSVAKSDLLSPRRARSIVRPRQVGMYLAKSLTTRSLPEIGRRFGGRDHSTVLHAIRKIDELMKEDERLAREVELLVQLLEP